MLNYIIQTIAFQLMFLVAYDLFLKKETFFNYNRLYLLGTSILSLLLPLIKIQSFTQAIPKKYIVTLPEVVIGNISSNVEVNNQLLNQANNFLDITINSILFFGALIALFFFTYRIIKIGLLIVKSSKSKELDITIVKLKNTNTAFSFFKYIFLGDELSNNEKVNILEHERVHVRQLHSIDLLWFEALKVIFWFNPLIYIYQNRISNIHEFIADKKAVKENNKTEYYQRLLQQVFNVKHVSFINPFFKKSLIKKRIIMLNKTKSKQVNLVKYALLIPMVFAMLVYSSCSEANTQDGEPESINETKINTYTKIKAQEEIKIEDLEVPFAVIDKAPVYPGCESIANEEARKKCFQSKVATFVSENFNVKSADNLGLVGNQRITAVFKVSKEGNIENVRVRAPHDQLEKEVKRMLESLPKMEAGEENGKKVIVPYLLPIKFVVKS